MTSFKNRAMEALFAGARRQRHRLPPAYATAFRHMLSDHFPHFSCSSVFFRALITQILDLFIFLAATTNSCTSASRHGPIDQRPEGKGSGICYMRYVRERGCLCSCYITLKNPSASFNTLQTVQSTDCFTNLIQLIYGSISNIKIIYTCSICSSVQFSQIASKSVCSANKRGDVTFLEPLIKCNRPTCYCTFL